MSKKCADCNARYLRCPRFPDGGLKPEPAIVTRLGDIGTDTIRLKLLKIGAIVRVSVRRVLLQLSSASPRRTSTRRPSTPCAAEPRSAQQRTSFAPPTPRRPHAPLKTQ